MSDEAFEAHAVLLSAWGACYPHEPTLTLTGIIGDIQIQAAVGSAPKNEWDALRDALGEFDDRYDGQRLRSKSVGKALNKLTGRVINHQYLAKGDRAKTGTKWTMKTLKPSQREAV